jgi:hypothetical protein
MSQKTFAIVMLVCGLLIAILGITGFIGLTNAAGDPAIHLGVALIGLGLLGYGIRQLRGRPDA